MSEHIAYAMRNTEATQSLFYFNRPSELLDWSFLAIEMMVFTGFILALWHAYRFKRNTGSVSALLTFLGCMLYGLLIDILSYYTVENFWHGEFSVMLLFNRLPLYIVCFYPAFMYHMIMIIRRYQFPPVTEAICTGFIGGLTYLIFDNFGPMMNWWIWDQSDPTTWPYINSVPLTSYAWFFLFTAAFTMINRFISWQWVEQGVSQFKLVLAHIFQPIVTVLLGTLLFVPYNLFSKSTQPFDMLPWNANLQLAAIVHCVTFALAGFLFLAKWRKPVGQADCLLLVFPFIYLVGHAYLYIAKFDRFFKVTEQGLVDGLAVGNLIAVLLALIAASLIFIVSQPRQE